MTRTVTRPSATGAPGYSETLPCAAASARPARLLIGAALHTWNFGCLVDPGRLIVSELVSNAVQHSGSRDIRVGITLPAAGRVRILVSDKSCVAPIIREPQGDEESGRGLLVISEIAADWGADHRRWGKVVWAELIAFGPERERQSCQSR
ncbi:ATP-binding protein [Streptomyces sp. NPDC088725]|uniref:ATP-binding protein n=1 Tax=Streptomyces sp. NPDC088725 TaxID=3365873 RepID=UPI0037F33B24